ncbi:hypothetical protein [Cohnella nanjingensis]|uniref:hypothetical protein n=1 Tax=Cohnella nanjingensis TaxID=1387779 RepID=UPI001C88A7D3|nr:hypothetical protein [Cohnella nanjingensis]
MVREVKQAFIIMRIDGVPVNVRYEPASSVSAAARFYTIADYETFINGFYKPPDVAMYKPVKVTITYEVNEDERDAESLPEDQRCHEGHPVPAEG